MMIGYKSQSFCLWSPSFVLLKAWVHISIFFVLIFKDDTDAQRESLIKALCIYLNENPNVLVQEYTVSVLSRFWLYNMVKLCIQLFLWLYWAVKDLFINLGK